MLLFIAFAVLWGQQAHWLWYVVAFIFWAFSKVEFK